MSEIRMRQGSSSGTGTCILWLRLAAAPTFAAMALLSGLSGDGPAEILCLTADHASPLTGMTAMYALMCAFHLPPWLTLRQRGGIRR
ncbi:hypothetical protein [Pelagibius sp. 7325]|uniref:hypothetical protein n=1 Tax=Pelagibius sp. 7325 TaxID=3131994 RepID=UPI0030EE44C6